MIELMFDDMDRNLREMGVSDTGMHRRMKQITEAFYGRLTRYGAAWHDTPLLTEALRQNVYATLPESEALKPEVQAHTEQLAEYTQDALAGLCSIPLEAMLSGKHPGWLTMPIVGAEIQ